MTYIPTKEELEQLGFKNTHNPDNYFLNLKSENKYIFIQPDNSEFWIAMSKDDEAEELSVYFYPKSLSDLKYFVLMFTPE